MNARVAVIVINWNGLEDTRHCLASLLDTTYPEKRICVVDNGSIENEAELLLREFPKVEALRVDDNLGYAGACNTGVSWARRTGADFVCLLNNDTVVASDFLDVLRSFAAGLRSPAIIAPLILRPDGTTWSAGGLLAWPNVAGEHLGLGKPADGFETPFRADWASGCALFFSLAVFEQVGPLDERFFLYLEDVEWCIRARKRGVEVWIVPAARITHGVNQTVRRTDPRLARYYSYRNFYLLGLKHGTFAWRLWYLGHFCLTLAKIGIRNLLYKEYRRDSYYNARTRGLLDLIALRLGKAPYEHTVKLTADTVA